MKESADDDEARKTPMGTRRTGRRAVVVTCAEVSPASVNFAAHDIDVVDLIQNGGGVLSSDALRSIELSIRSSGTELIVLVQHVGCEFLAFTEDFQRLQIATPDRELSPDILDDVIVSIRATSLPALRSPGGPPADRKRLALLRDNQTLIPIL